MSRPGLFHRRWDREPDPVDPGPASEGLSRCSCGEVKEPDRISCELCCGFVSANGARHEDEP